MTLRQRWSDRWSWPMLALGCVALSVFMQVSGVSQAAALESEHLSLRPAGTEYTYDSPTCVSAELVEGLSRGPSPAAGSIGSVKIAPCDLGCDYDPSASFVAPRAVHGLPTPGSVARRINPQQQAGHVSGTPQYANRIKQGKPTSVFHASENADSLTLYAWQHGTPTANPNIRIFDFQRPIGTGFYGGSQTQVRVSVNSRGQIHGSPWGPELP